MLSYRHAFHAGNHADTLKHAIISRITLALKSKEKPFSYIDTHAGAGLYALDGEWAQKTKEAEDGILSLIDRDDWPETLVPYLDICKNLYAASQMYPGSPEIVRALSRNSDHLTLMEMHPTEIQVLRQNFSGDSRIHIHNRDGYKGIQSLCPPEPRRGFALIDPSYETVDDYAHVAQTILSVNQHWPIGIITIWYPILVRRVNEIFMLKDRIQRANIPGILCAELYIDEITTETPEFGLIGSGMLIIRPPWKIEEEIAILLDYLARTLGKNGKGSSTLTWLSAAT